MAERRFDDDEVREILIRATEPRDVPAAVVPATPASAQGHSLTLAELQDVAREVGIAPARVAEAATALEVERGSSPTETYLGVPISASHVVRLPRMLEPAEWDRFVVHLRDTFDAEGSVRTEGSLQTWSNGNLKVLLEPLDEGARLRFQSMHGMSRSHLEGGVVSVVSGLVLGLTLGALSIFTGKAIPWGLFATAAAFPVMGVGMYAIGLSKAAEWLPVRRSDFLMLGREALRVAQDGDAEEPSPEP